MVREGGGDRSEFRYENGGRFCRVHATKEDYCGRSVHVVVSERQRGGLGSATHEMMPS